MTENTQGIGCATIVIGVNAVVMGALALTFERGPYSGREQEIWYRYGSLGFVLFGAILPSVALVVWGRRSRTLVAALVVWAAAVLFACFAYAISSGGGV